MAFSRAMSRPPGTSSAKKGSSCNLHSKCSCLSIDFTTPWSPGFATFPNASAAKQRVRPSESLSKHASNAMLPWPLPLCTTCPSISTAVLRTRGCSSFKQVINTDETLSSPCVTTSPSALSAVHRAGPLSSRTLFSSAATAFASPRSANCATTFMAAFRTSSSLSSKQALAAAMETWLPLNAICANTPKATERAVASTSSRRLAISATIRPSPFVATLAKAFMPAILIPTS
mmetsp:Transcript_133800/g.286155  ORF Transcript_133800/g.286155 Transcript_133800/m.286155 type:complete len:231 (-) Transcript_133800:618-1310(-)